MDTITTVLVLLFAVVVSGAISRILPLPIPRPLVQIAFGGLIGFIPDLHVELNPEIFFLLFVPPLLFVDGWRIPKEELLKDRNVILQLALGLVIFTVVGIGLFVHWMIPAMPLAVAFALAAVLSPTDPIAVSAIAARVSIPRRMMSILEGESLLNDASGLVCFRFATTAALTGAFSAQDAALNFFSMTLGGMAVGFGTTWITAYAKEWISRRAGEESGSQIIVSLLIPFASYLLAERLHFSGILAAVAAGVTMSFVEASARVQATTRMRRNTFWDTVQFAANGVTFVLLGEQLPRIIGTASETLRGTPYAQTWWLLIYVLAISLGLAALRFLWVWVSLKLNFFSRKRDGERSHKPHWHLVAATSLAGVRGTITLAGVLTLPVELTHGVAFPARDLAIFLSMGVIVVSLVVASVCLPLLLQGMEMPPENAPDASELFARNVAAEAAIAEIERQQKQLSAARQDAEVYVVAASLITDLYRGRIEQRSQEGKAAILAQRSEAIERTMRIAAVQAERASIYELLQNQKISTKTARKLVRELDLMEARYESMVRK